MTNEHFADFNIKKEALKGTYKIMVIRRLNKQYTIVNN
jgi:hypothetical protein